MRLAILFRVLISGLLASLTTGSLHASGTVPHAVAEADTLLPNDISYQGYRIEIKNVRILKQRKGKYLMTMGIVNTGRRPVSFGPGFPMRLLQTQFDESLSAGGLIPLAEPIRAALTTTREKLAVGGSLDELELWIDPSVSAAEPELNVDRLDKSSSKKRRKNGGANDQPIEAIAAAKPDTDVIVNEPPRAVFASTKTLEPANCGDLSFKSLRIVEQDRHFATIAFALTNSGTGTLDLRQLPTGTSMTLFISGTPSLSSSSRRVAQLDLAELLVKQASSLPPSAVVEFVRQVDIRQATRYTSVLVAQLDSAQSVEECNETNNEGHVLLE